MRIPLPPVPVPDEVVALSQEYAAGRRTPVEPRDAATVVLVRDGAGGPELYLLRRHTSMAFAAGMAVFPGGGVDPRDFDADLGDGGWAGPPPAAWADRLGVDVDRAAALVCAAVRETFEESGVLLAGASADEVVADTTGDDWEADRVALETHELAFTDFLARRGLVLRTDLLGVWDAWVTPRFEPKRYRTWFFTAALPAGQRTRDVSTESSSVEWVPAADAVAAAETGSTAMMPPTYLTCLDVAQQSSAAAVLAEAGRRTVEMFEPDVEPLPDGGWTMSMPDRMRPVLAAHRG
ncbi:NUDIX hydrolase [Nocardioides sp. CPCC 205120]|uniref:NUDIX hydrolase n=1 Tax=Nocardioides sp. CPCC 205120 TaxID=3406462 RepID=UPI003B510983